jgi:flagellar basal-body rod protein FlgC
MNIDRVFSALAISAQGMSAQRKRMDAIASNIANVETTRTEEGGPYRRKVVQFEATSRGFFGSLVRKASLALSATHRGHIGGGAVTSTRVPETVPQLEAAEKEDPTGPKMVYDPSHPDANAEGYVAMPNVNIVTEMVNMISASRAYEANVVTVTAAKNMAKDALEI